MARGTTLPHEGGTITVAVTEATHGEVDPQTSRRFWEQRALLATDPRSVTLSRESVASVRRNIRQHQRWMLRNLAALGCSFEHVADLACGNGDWTVVLAERARRLFASDFAQGMVDATRARIEAAGRAIEASFVTSDLASVALPRDLDLVVCGAVLQCVGDRAAVVALANIRRALRRGGLAYVRTTVSQTGSTQVIDDEVYQAVYRTPEAYRGAFAAAGLEVVIEDDATDFIADEVVHDLLGSRVGRSVAGRALATPIRAVRRLYRGRRPRGVRVWILRRPILDVHLDALAA